MTDDLEQYALDWARIVDDWIKKVAAEMDDAYEHDDLTRYRFAARLQGDMQTAQQVMLKTLPRPPRTPELVPQHGLQNPPESR